MNTQMMDLNTHTGLKHIFDEQLNLTGITEYGIGWEEMLAGEINLPLQGARFDIAFEGKLIGESINGVIKGVDYLVVRPDGKFILDMHATIITDDGETIAVKEDGLLSPTPDGIGILYICMHFLTASPKYQWINKKQVWTVGEANMLKGEVKVSGYSN